MRHISIAAPLICLALVALPGCGSGGHCDERHVIGAYVTFSHDGSRAVSAKIIKCITENTNNDSDAPTTTKEEDTAGVVHFHERATGSWTFEVMTKPGPWAVAFSPDEKRIATADEDHHVYIVSTANGSRLKTLHGNTEGAWSVAWSPDGRTIAAGGRDRRIRLWDAETGALLRTLDVHGDGVRSVAFSPDGALLASAGFWDGTARIWHVETGALLRTLEAGLGRVDSVAFSHDGKWLASTDGWDAHLWSVATGEMVRTFDGNEWILLSLAFSPDDKHLVTGSELGVVRLWDTGTGLPVRNLPAHEGPVFSVAYSSRGILTVAGDGYIRLFDPETSRMKWQSE